MEVRIKHTLKIKVEERLLDLWERTLDTFEGEEQQLIAELAARMKHNDDQLASAAKEAQPTANQ